jgi:hypothetical protein
MQVRLGPRVTPAAIVGFAVACGTSGPGTEESTAIETGSAESIGTEESESTTAGEDTGDDAGFADLPSTHECGDGSPTPAEICLRVAYTLPVGGTPAALASADFDGNGGADLLVAVPTATGLTAFFGSGDGFLGDPLISQVGTGTRGIGLAHFDGDAWPDLVVANVFSGVSGLAIADAPGSFGPPGLILTGMEPRSVSIADLDDDGDPEAIVADEAGGAVHILSLNMTGQLALISTHAVGVEPYDAALDDVDGDGELDIVTANEGSDDFSFLRGLGDGGFDPAITIDAATGSGPRGIAALHREVDGTEQTLVALANFGLAQIQFFPFEGGGFGAAETVSVGAEPYALRRAELDGAIGDEWVVAGSGDDTVVAGIWVDGAWQTQTWDVGSQPLDVLAIDLNGDGLHEIASANTFSGDVTVLINDP